MKKLIPLLLSFISLSGNAAERQFDVEMIIFKRAVDPDSLQEFWPNQPPAIDLSQAALLQNSDYLEAKGVTLLSPSEYQLEEQEKQLEQHAGYNVLVHTAWRQGDEAKGHSPVFHILAGHDYSGHYAADGREKSTNILTGSDTGISDVQEQNIDNPLYELDGKLQVYVQHYLFLEADLDLKSPGIREVTLEDKPLDLTTDPADENTTVQFGHLESVSPTIQVERFLKSYRMSQKRRMRSGEIHYLDHPLMGIIIQVRKVEEAEQTES